MELHGNTIFYYKMFVNVLVKIFRENPDMFCPLANIFGSIKICIIFQVAKQKSVNNVNMYLCSGASSHGVGWGGVGRGEGLLYSTKNEIPINEQYNA